MSMWREIKDIRFIDWHNIHKTHKRKIATSHTSVGTFLGVVCLECLEVYIYDVIVPEKDFYK